MSAELARAEDFNIADNVRETARVEDRYAVALIELATEADALPQVEADMAVLASAIDSSDDLRFAMAHPLIDRDTQQNIFKSLGAKMGLTPLTLKFLALVASKKRQDILPAIIEAFQQECDKRRGEVTAIVRTAVVLSPAQEEDLARVLSAKHNAKVRLSITVDDSLLGGMTIQIGDKFYDRTLKSQLSVLKHNLEEAA